MLPIQMKLVWILCSWLSCVLRVSWLAQDMKESFKTDCPRAPKKSTISSDMQKEIACFSIFETENNLLQTYWVLPRLLVENQNLMLQLGHFSFIFCKRILAIPLIYMWCEEKNISHLVMNFDVISFSSMFDAAFSLRKGLEKIHFSL